MTTAGDLLRGQKTMRWTSTLVAGRGFAGTIVAEDAPIATEGLDATGRVGLDDAHREMLPQCARDFDLDGVRLADVRTGRR